jgi:hypothetical protein
VRRHPIGDSKVCQRKGASTESEENAARQPCGLTGAEIPALGELWGDGGDAVPTRQGTNLDDNTKPQLSDGLTTSVSRVQRSGPYWGWLTGHDHGIYNRSFSHVPAVKTFEPRNTGAGCSARGSGRRLRCGGVGRSGVGILVHVVLIQSRILCGASSCSRL